MQQRGTMPKYAARSDGNQQDIMDAARAVGCSAFSIHRVGGGKPDIIIGDPRTLQNYLIECKVGNAPLTPLEVIFFDEWLGQKAIARSPEEMFRVIGRM